MTRFFQVVRGHIGTDERLSNRRSVPRTQENKSRPPTLRTVLQHRGKKFGPLITKLLFGVRCWPDRKERFVPALSIVRHPYQFVLSSIEYETREWNVSVGATR